MQPALYFNQKRFVEKEFTKESELENLMYSNAKIVEGEG